MAVRPYKVVCVSMYIDDLAELDARVAQRKQAGDRRASRSRMIRDALKLCFAAGVVP